MQVGVAAQKHHVTVVNQEEQDAAVLPLLALERPFVTNATPSVQEGLRAENHHGSVVSQEQEVGVQMPSLVGRPFITNAVFASQQSRTGTFPPEMLSVREDEGSEPEGSSRETMPDSSGHNAGPPDGERWDWNADEGLAHAGDGSSTAFVNWVSYISGILPSCISARDNPFRRLCRLALASPILLDVITTLVTECVYSSGHGDRDCRMRRHDSVLNSFHECLDKARTAGSSSVNENMSPKQATLAAVLLQVANIALMGGSGVDIHLICAMHFVQDLGYIDRPVEGVLERLLVQRFAMLDVTTAILRRRRPHLPPSFWLFTPNERYDRTEPSFREMTGCPQPLLGFLSRLAHLAVDLKESPDDNYPVLRKASTLETDIRIYARSRVTFHSTRPNKTRHLDCISQCFYWCTHLILQRVINRDMTSSYRVQQTVRDMVSLIKSIPLGCGLDSSLEFPFYLSSCEAITEEHRNWVRGRNNELRKIYLTRLRQATLARLEER